MHFPLAHRFIPYEIVSQMIPSEQKSFPVFLETLEDRIAPASIVFSQGGNLLSAGDEGKLSLGESSAALVKVVSGKALVFWDAQDKVIKGISVTNGVKLEVWGNIAGDIVTNLLPTGDLTDTDGNVANGFDGGKLLASSISGIKVSPYIDQTGNFQSGNVGRIVAGGSVSNVIVSGSLGGIFAGDGIFDAIATADSTVLTPSTPATTYTFEIGYDFDSSGPIDATAMTLTRANATFGAKASISNVSFTTGQNVQIFAGDGLDGVAGAFSTGGLVSKLHFVATTTDPGITTNFFAGKSITVSAGDGGSGLATGGIGGSITNLLDLGTSGNVVIHAGHGGNGTTTGGAGGSVALLDLRGTPQHYYVQAGDGGTGGTRGGAGGHLTNNNLAAVGSSQFLTLAGDFHTDFSDGPLTDAERGFFVINRSSGEMVLIAGDSLNPIGPTILPEAANPVDAIVTDLNGDKFLDIVVAYSDGNFGILINDQADGFTYSTASLGGLIPTKVIAGDFLGDGGLPELVFISSSASETTLKLFEITNSVALAGANPAEAFSSDPSRIKPFTYAKGNMVGAAGGSFPLTTLGALNLNSDDQNDLLLAFGDGRVQGVFSTGSGTTADPFQFSVGSGPQAAPFAMMTGGIRDMDFNFAKEAGQQRLALVNAGGSKAHVGTIGAATLSAPATIAISTAALPMPATGSGGTIFQSQWTSSKFDPTDLAPTTLTLLTSLGSSSSILAYDAALVLKNVYRQDFLINGMTNNFLFTSKLEAKQADSFLFTQPSAVEALVFQKPLPAGSFIPFSPITLPYSAKSATLVAGDGGEAGKSTGGMGGNIVGLNLDSGTSEVFAGNGGASSLGAGGNGGFINNAKSFKTAGNTTIVPAFTSSGDLTLQAGNGADGTGTPAAAKGGIGGAIRSLLILDAATLEMKAGDGGNSHGGASGAGGNLDSITVFNVGSALLKAGDGGEGDTSALAAGGKGGNVTKITLGSGDPLSGKAVTGNVMILAGQGGDSALSRGGVGGLVSTVVAGNFLNFSGSLSIHAGRGGDSYAPVPSMAGGVGGATTAVTLKGVNGSISIQSGGGGSAVAGIGGNGGSITNIVSTNGGILSAIAGEGGLATGVGSKGKGGIGGLINGLTAEMNNSGYSNIFAGNGGSSVGGAGGAGGAIANVSLKLNPSNNTGGDDTLGVVVQTGKGGSGASGGVGGLLSLFQATGIYDQAIGSETVINSIALLLVAGDGGDGSLTTGGAGGAIRLSKTQFGISHIDPDSANGMFTPFDEGLRVFAGNGGDGFTRGGVGGLVSGVKAANTTSAFGNLIPVNLLGGAYIKAGDGGDTVKGAAGAGGAISALNLGVEDPGTTTTGNLRIQSGNGGTAITGTGGHGGTVTGSTLIAITGNDTAGYATLVTSGNGGDGTIRAGNGGRIASLIITLPQVGVGNSAPNIYSGVFIAGSGGDGTGALKSYGGIGGAIASITQSQNIYSVINLLQAGSGGNSSADVPGGIGGTVSSINSAGNIGAQTAKATVGGPDVPLGIYNTIATSGLIDSLVSTPDLQQGVFAGIGGTGSVDGKNGSVTSIKARTISAIAAANLSGDFAKATAVSSVTTFLLGFDIDGSGTYEPGDGFVMSGNNKITGLNSFNTQIITNAQLQAATAPFIIP